MIGTSNIKIQRTGAKEISNGQGPLPASDLERSKDPVVACSLVSGIRLNGWATFDEWKGAGISTRRKRCIEAAKVLAAKMNTIMGGIVRNLPFLATFGSRIMPTSNLLGLVLIGSAWSSAHLLPCFGRHRQRQPFVLPSAVGSQCE